MKKLNLHSRPGQEAMPSWRSLSIQGARCAAFVAFGPGNVDTTWGFFR
ncbi:MAG: hypothetical protein SFX73_33790 [Kofleriaceae bacterium]|nr:hypothetical protein [Kofleriaceae bacterium]